MLGDSDEIPVEGVLKVNSRILEAHELRKLDKSEKSLVNAIHTAGKGRMSFICLQFVVVLLHYWYR
jgi:hypothetical protein